MMITYLKLSNFKSWASVEMPRLAPITGVFGPNSSGKSSLLQFLLLLKQTAESTDRGEVLHFGAERDYVALGSLREVLHGHDENACLGWNLHWKLPDKLSLVDPEKQGRILLAGDQLGFGCEVLSNGSGAPSVKSFHYSFEDHTFHMTQADDSRNSYDVSAQPDTFQFKRSVGRPRLTLPPPVKCFGFPDEVRAAYQNAGFLVDFELAFSRLFDRVYYLGPLREHPRRQYVWAGSQPEDVGQRGERAIEALLSARQRDLKVRPGRSRRAVPLEIYVAKQLRNLGVVHNFEVQAVAPGSDIYRVWVQVRSDSERVLLTDVGFGVSQVLPVVVLCYYAPEGSIILLEQPEIHLHPSVQAALADVLIDAMKARHIQLIVESHSEHLLLRLQRRIAEEHRRTRQDTPFRSDDAALYFCSSQQGRSKLVPLHMNLLGEIDNWPEGFFGDRLAETQATVQAQIRRRRAGETG